MKLRKIYNGRSQRAEIYECPDTAHWADWRDADAVRAHGRLIAEKRNDRWYDWRDDGILDADVSANEQQYSGMKPVGIAT